MTKIRQFQPHFRLKHAKPTPNKGFDKTSNNVYWRIILNAHFREVKMALSFKKIKETALGLPSKLFDGPKTSAERNQELDLLEKNNKSAKRKSRHTAKKVAKYGSGLSVATGCLFAFFCAAGEISGCNTGSFAIDSAIGGAIGATVISASSYAVHKAGNLYRSGAEAIKKIQCKIAKNKEDKAKGNPTEQITTTIIEATTKQQKHTPKKTYEDRKNELSDLRYEHTHSRRVSKKTAMGATVYLGGLSLATGATGVALSALLELNGMNSGELALNSALYSSLATIATPAVSYLAHKAGNVWRSGTEVVKEIQCEIAKHKEEKANNMMYEGLAFAR